MTDWWIDETLPVGPPESVTQSDYSTLATLNASSYMEWVNKFYDNLSGWRPTFFFPYSPRPPLRPKHKAAKLRPYKHDPPTNRLYPTSFDSWFNGYNRPSTPQQISVSKRYRHSRRR